MASQFLCRQQIFRNTFYVFFTKTASDFAYFIHYCLYYADYIHLPGLFIVIVNKGLDFFEYFIYNSVLSANRIVC